MEKRGAKLEKLKRLILPACLFGFCVALYFLTAPKGSRSVQTSDGYTTKVFVATGSFLPTAVPSYSFMDIALENGFSGELVQTGIGAAEIAYDVAREGGGAAQLLLKLEEGAVYAVQLTAVRPEEQVANSVIRAELLMGCSYDEYVQWLENCTSALACALNAGIDAAGCSDIAECLRLTADDGERRDIALNGLSATISINTMADPELLCIWLELV